MIRHLIFAPPPCVIDKWPCAVRHHPNHRYMFRQDVSDTFPQQQTEVPAVTLKHVALIPSSFFEIFPDARPSDLLAILSDSILSSVSVCHLEHALINNRVVTVLSAQKLLVSTSNADDDTLPSLALFSPCLHSAVVSSAPVTLRPCTQPISSLKAVTLALMLPLFLPAEYAKRAANLAKSALLNRDLWPYDVLPVSESLWFVVVSVEPNHSKSLVTASTNIAVTLSHQVIPRGIQISGRLRDWTLRKWRPEQRFILSSDLCRLTTALDSQPALLLLTGPLRDAAALLVHALHARPVLNVRLANPHTLLSAVARAELYSASTSLQVIITLPTVSNSFVPKFLSVFSRQSHPRAHFGASSDGAITFVLCASHMDDVDIRLQRHIDTTVSIKPPDDPSRKHLLGLAEVPSGNDFDRLIKISAGLARRDVYALGRLYIQGGLPKCLEAMRRYGEKGVSVDTGGISWDDIGGLEFPKNEISKLLSPRHGSSGNRNRRVGVLLYGPPGTGKTLLARAVAGEASYSFMSVKGPELLDMYVGESERNLREVFERACSSAPTVIFFDEVDALAPRRGSAADSGRVADRVVSQLLSEMDNIVIRGDIFVIAATNRPDLVDEALLRPGRLDKLIFVGMPTSRAEQAVILRAQTRKFKLSSDINWEDVLSTAPKPPLLSGADLYGLASRAWMHAARRVITGNTSRGLEGDVKSEKRVISKLLSSVNDVESLDKTYCSYFTLKSSDAVTKSSNDEVDSNHSPVEVTSEDFEKAAKELKPSLTEQQLRDYEALRKHLENYD